MTNCLQTLCALFYAIFKKQATDVGFDVINSIFTLAEVENKMKRLISQCNNLLISMRVHLSFIIFKINKKYKQGDVTDDQRFMCLKLLLVLVTGTNCVSQNILLEYIMLNSMFDSFIRLLSDSTMRAQHGHDVVILLTLLVNYRKYETANPYIVQLSILADELALNGYGQMISTSLIEFGRQYTQNLSEIQPSSWFSSLSNIVGNMFVSDEGCERVQQIRANNALLLALYEAVHLNRNFITTLAHTQAESSAPPSPSNTLNANQPVPDLATIATQVPANICDVTQQYPTNLLVAVFQYWYETRDGRAHIRNIVK